jgi:TolB protein
VSSGWWDTGFPRDGNGDPQWTPDGKKIVYVSWENGRPEIFIMNADGSNRTRLTTAEFRDENPEITPDGQYILFSSRRSNIGNGIVIMSLDGNNQRVLSNGICPVACR